MRSLAAPNGQGARQASVRDFKIIKIGISRSYADAYDFLIDARSFSAWGGGDPGTPAVPLGDRDWMVQVDGVKLVLRYGQVNQFGILDYQAFRPGAQPGPATPARLYPNAQGAELTYVYFRRPDQPAAQFASGAEWLESDLLRLKSFIEKDRPPLPLFASTIISLVIERPVREVFRFLIEPLNFPKWAAVTGHRFEPRGGRDWLADMAAGPRMIRFCEPNEYGVLDHAVFAEGETPITNPMRVVANEEGTLLTYTAFQRPGVSDEKFTSTVEWITSDLMTAKSLLEV